MSDVNKWIASVFIFIYCLHTNADDRSSFCYNYAKLAVQQYNKNIQQNCGFKGLRWSDNKKGQQEWCKSTSKTIAQKEIEARQNLLKRCSIKLANKKLISSIPLECRSNKNNQSTILSPYGESGVFVTTDVNKDQQIDFIYFEKTKNKYGELNLCLSDKQYHYRKIQVDLGITAASVVEERYQDDLDRFLFINGNKATLMIYDRTDSEHYGTTTYEVYFVFDQKS